MNKLKLLFWGILGFPIGLVIYLVYVHVVSLIDPILTIWFGGGLFIALLLGLIVLVKNIAYIIYTFFKRDRGIDEKGFKIF